MIVKAEALLYARAPLNVSVWGLTMLAPPPPSGAATVLAALQILSGGLMAGAGSLWILSLLVSFQREMCSIH